MNEAIKLLLSLSVSGTILAGLLFALKPFLRQKLSKTVQYYIWIIVLVRLVLPFSFQGSVMNELFYGTNQEVNPVVAVQPVGSGQTSLPGLTNVSGNIANGYYNGDTDHNRYSRELISQYALYLWLLGAIAVLSVNITSYTKFINQLGQTNIPATEEENAVLATLLKGRNIVKLERNRFVGTPLLVGILRPIIIIPDVPYTEVQLTDILRHELVHLQRFDIGVKWLTMLAASIHWFNPLMFLIKKELNRACELACDEAVIQNLSPMEKQAYGRTLISMVSEQKYPLGILQATMCEQKHTLKERLVAIMAQTKHYRYKGIISGVVLVSVIAAAIYLGAGVGLGNTLFGSRSDTPPDIFINAELQETKVARLGPYSWRDGDKGILADSDHPVNLQYKLVNTVSVSRSQALVITTGSLTEHEITLASLSVYQGGELIEFEPNPSLLNGDLHLQAPPEQGQYVYSLDLEYGDKGTATYGFLVLVDTVVFDLEEIAKHKTPYVGDNSKVASLAGSLPAPLRNYKQQFISIKSEKPYGLTIYYEPVLEGLGMMPYSTVEGITEGNALVVFSMVDNLDQVTFAFRNTQSEDGLDPTKYFTDHTFQRRDFEERYDDLSELGEDLNALEAILTGR